MGQQKKTEIVGLATVLLVCLHLCGCSPKSLVSEDQEVAVGQQASAQIESQYPVSRDPGLNSLVNTIGQNLLVFANPRPGIVYKFKVLDINDINAFSLPGGWIYVDRGLIDATNGNRDEIAGVIAHEIGHVQARHYAEIMGRAELYGIAIGTLTQGNAAQWASVFANLNLLRWSRKEEYEADRLAIDYMLPSQYNPQGLIDFLKVVEQTQGESRSALFLQTHPLTSDRIQRDQEYLNQQLALRGRQ